MDEARRHELTHALGGHCQAIAAEVLSRIAQPGPVRARALHADEQVPSQRLRSWYCPHSSHSSTPSPSHLLHGEPLQSAHTDFFGSSPKPIHSTRCSTVVATARLGTSARDHSSTTLAIS